MELNGYWYNELTAVSGTTATSGTGVLSGSVSGGYSPGSGTVSNTSIASTGTGVVSPLFSPVVRPGGILRPTSLSGTNVGASTGSGGSGGTSSGTGGFVPQTFAPTGQIGGGGSSTVPFPVGGGGTMGGGGGAPGGGEAPPQEGRVASPEGRSTGPLVLLLLIAGVAGLYLYSQKKERAKLRN